MVGNTTTWHPEPSKIRNLFKIIRHVSKQKLLRMRKRSVTNVALDSECALINALTPEHWRLPGDCSGYPRAVKMAQ